MRRARLLRPLSLLLALVLWTAAWAGEGFRYPEARYGKGELRYVNHLPVLVVQGTPEEMGEQLGVLALKAATGLKELSEGFVKAQGWDRNYPWLVQGSQLLAPRFPPDHLQELEAVARASGWRREVLLLANTLPDLQRVGECSALIVEPERSATGAPLFGRNQDSPPFGPLHDYALVAVYRPAGKRAFASITYPGLLGCFSGMNDAGLAVADLTVQDANDGSPKLDLRGTPCTLALRRVLEECATVEEAEKLLRSLKRTSRNSIVLCDRNHGAVFETTPRSFAVRVSEEGIGICTNHFRTEGLATSLHCGRYALLEKSRKLEKLELADVARFMDAASQGDWTQQTMIFEPRTLKLHLAMGQGPATRLPLRTLELAVWFTSGH